MPPAAWPQSGVTVRCGYGPGDAVVTASSGSPHIEVMSGVAAARTVEANRAVSALLAYWRAAARRSWS